MLPQCTIVRVHWSVSRISAELFPDAAPQRSPPRFLRMPMKRGFASLFFKAARNMTRLQSKMVRAGTRTLAAQAKAGARRAKAAPRKAPATPGPASWASGLGTWQPSLQVAAPGGRRLAYARYQPAGPVKGLPLLVMLHGCRQTASDFARGTRMNLLADRMGFAVLYPQQAQSRQSQRCWRWFEPGRGGREDADAIAALIRVEIARHDLDARRVYIAGLSAGAGMAALIALRHPDLVAAVALHSGVVMGSARNAVDGLSVMRRGTLRAPGALVGAVAHPEAFRLGMPALILHGQRDNAVSVRNAQQLAEQFRHLNGLPPGDSVARVLAEGTKREYRRVDTLRGRTPVVRLCEIPRLTHAWSGGDGAIEYHADTGPDASVLLWQFFRRHTRP